MTGVPRRSARSRFDHIRRRSRQKSPTARKITLGFAPVPLYKVTNVGAKASAPPFPC